LDDFCFLLSSESIGLVGELIGGRRMELLLINEAFSSCGLWPPPPGAAATDRPSQPYACYQSYEKDVPTHTVYRQDLTVTPFAQASSDKPERTRTRIPRRASPHPTIEHTSVNHTPKEKGMEGNEGRSRSYSA
jgi:hypothetical protein